MTDDTLIDYLTEMIIETARLRHQTKVYQNMNSAIVSVTNDIDLKLMEIMRQNNENIQRNKNTIPGPL